MTNYLGMYFSKVLQFKEQTPSFSTFWPLSILVDAAYEYKQSRTTFFGVALEIIIFYNSSKITDKLGFFWPILLSQIFQLFRFLAYYTLEVDNPNSFAICCFIELLKGANYALIHTSALQLANSFCPAQLKTTSQLIYNGVFVAIGTVLSGLFFKRFFSKVVDDVDVCYSEFKKEFQNNIYFSIIGMAFFVYKYAIRENLLFSRAMLIVKLKKLSNKLMKMKLIPKKSLSKTHNNKQKFKPSK